jgi:hypothetical protein
MLSIDLPDEGNCQECAEWLLITYSVPDYNEHTCVIKEQPQ